MKTAAIILFPEEVSKEDLRFHDFYLPDELTRRLRLIPQIDEVFIAVPEGFSESISDGCTKIPLEAGGELAFLKSFFSDRDFDHALLVHVDSPFLDPEISCDMLKLHTAYLPEYTYSENVPSGFCGEVVSRALLESVPENVDAALSLSSIIKSNLHKFDVEIYYSHPDIRDRRVSFRSMNPRERRVMEKIVGLHGGIPAYKEMKEVLMKFPESLFIAPSYVEIELTGRCDLDCAFCYRKFLSASRGDMEKSVFQKILEGMRAFGLPYHICFGGSGEPLMHPKFYEMMDMALAEQDVAGVIIETNGVLADAGFARYAAGKNGRVRVIVNLNGIDEKTYRDLHGKDCYGVVTSNVERMRSEISAKDALYVQIMKINEAEPFIDTYYDIWEQKRVPIILQKQNTYLGKIPDRRYSDLSPIERIPCWHLQRDIFILADGTVGFCKQDIDGNAARGNVKESSLLQIFEKGRNDFVEDFKGNLAKKPDCASCDEWYTFNL